MGEIQQYDSTTRICLLMTCPQEDVEGKPFSYIFKNSRSVTKEVIEDSNGVQTIHYDMEIYIVNNTKYIPFNRKYVVLDLIHGDLGGDVDFSVEFQPDLQKSFKEGIVTYYKNECRCEWEYVKGTSKESVLKYMIVPYALTMMQQLTHTVKRNDGYGDWIGICATFMLGDIALFFTIPTTNKLTCLEKSLFLNFFLKFWVAMFAFYDFDNSITMWFVHSMADQKKYHKLVDVFTTVVITILVFGYCSLLRIKANKSESNMIKSV